MADKTIGSLPQAQTVDDASLFVCEQQGTAMKTTGAQWKGFAIQAVSQYVEPAQQAAQRAQQAAQQATQAVSKIGTAVEDTKANAQAAQEAQEAAETAQGLAETAKTEAEAAASGVAEDAQAAEQAKEAAIAAQQAAETAGGNAETSATGAATSASQASQSASDASGSATAAAGSATTASQAASNAQSAQTLAETAKAGAEAARDAIVNMLVEAITLETGQPATVSKSLVDQVYKLTFGLPKGKTGATGATGPQGVSVESIQLTNGNHAPGTTDTYTITLSDGSAFQFTVYNGANGTGAGDFMADGSVPMTGPLNMGGNKITNLGAPGADTDAVRKSDLDAVAAEVDGILDGTTPAYIPPATTVKIGGVIIGDGLSVTKDGTLNADDQLPTGGTQGQVLTQGTTGPEWQDAPSGLPDGGTPGQVLTQGESGPEWTDAPDPLPTGGETGQVLTKTAEGSAWDDIPSDLPAGGTDGQILTKTAEGVAWEDAPEAGVTSFKGRTGAVTPQEGDYTAGMVGARPDTWTPTASEVGAIPNPSGGTTGQILEKTATGTQWADKPSGGISQSEADARYLQLSGGTMTGNINLNQKNLVFDSKGKITLKHETGNYRENSVTFRYVGTGAVQLKNIFNPDDLTDAANKAYVDALKPNRLTAVLSASGWSGNSQTITVSGVSADETAQLIMPVPALASQTAYYEAGILVTGQAANSLTFTCQTIPTADLTVYIVMQEVGA